jgi:ribosomal-protein-serine acetyltransferase
MERMDLGGGLELVPLTMSFDSEMHFLIEDNREYLARWLPWARSQNLAASREFLAKCEAEWASGQAYAFGMRLDGKLVGTLGCHEIDRVNRHASVGYWLAERYQGRGIVTRCVRAVTDCLFREFELNRVEIRAIPENKRSRAVAERCGYTFEGVLREVAVFYDGFTDLAVYSMLRREWPGADR